MTVRGLITVEMSPFMKPLRVMSATRTMAMIVRRPSVVSYAGALASTIAASAS